MFYFRTVKNKPPILSYLVIPSVRSYSSDTIKPSPSLLFQMLSVPGNLNVKTNS